MILRTGVDMVELERFDSVKPSIRERFLRRVFTPAELMQSGNQFDYFGGRFAVKEAVSKALGTGIGFVRWQDIECLDGQRGEPVLYLHGNAARIARYLGLEHWSVSITHTRTHAIAMAVALGSANERPFPEREKDVGAGQE
ncbi:MAG: holo-ACP synthase [Bellilinea sp.]|jgi:holo-[acyl-carrier protein] synthase